MPFILIKEADAPDAVELIQLDDVRKITIAKHSQDVNEVTFYWRSGKADDSMAYMLDAVQTGQLAALLGIPAQQMSADVYVV